MKRMCEKLLPSLNLMGTILQDEEGNIDFKAHDRNPPLTVIDYTGNLSLVDHLKSLTQGFFTSNMNP